MYSEYHLGRQAWRLCKRGTKYCGWHREMPEFYEWRHMCLTYDGFKDLYKVFVDGVKIESGSWTGDRTFEGVRKGGLLYLGQKQGSLGGDFNARQSWSGKLSQFNIWNWPLEDYFIENAAECRSDLLGNMVEWNTGNWFTGEEVRGEISLLCPPGQITFLSRIESRRNRCLSSVGRMMTSSQNIFSSATSLNISSTRWETDL